MNITINDKIIRHDIEYRGPQHNTVRGIPTATARIALMKQLNKGQN